MPPVSTPPRSVRRSARSSIGSSPTSIRSAGASPATASARRSDGSRELIPLEQHEVPTGTQVFDWTVPQEWNIRDAYVKDRHGRRVIDFAASNLHVVGYSTPVDARMTLAELREHLFTIPEQPDWVPLPDLLLPRDLGLLSRATTPCSSWRTSDYEVRIDSTSRRRPPHLRRVLSPRRAGGRGADLGARLPSVARERQPLRHRRRDAARTDACGAAAAAFPTASSSCPARSARSPG